MNEEVEWDDDVIQEEERVAQLADDKAVIKVENFRKIYSAPCKKETMAVEKTSFALDYGECFALLGVNGAGKTTTFKSMTGEINPTQGSVMIKGLNIP